LNAFSNNKGKAPKSCLLYETSNSLLLLCKHMFVTNQQQLQTKSKFLFGHAFERDEYFEA